MFVLLRLVINAVALLVTAWIIPGIHLGAAGPYPTKHDWAMLLIVALIFGVVNVVIRPIIVLLSLPLEIITLGLFTFVINGFMLLLTSWISRGMGVGFRVDGFLPEPGPEQDPLRTGTTSWLERAETERRKLA